MNCTAALQIQHYWLLLISDSFNICKYINKAIIPTLVKRGRQRNKISHCWAEEKGKHKVSTNDFGKGSNLIPFPIQSSLKKSLTSLIEE